MTKKPPEIFNDAIATEIAANNPVKDPGIYFPSINSMPPTIIIPDTAFVTDINGECKAGVTPQTT